MISGLHHITAIAGSAQRNYDFYAGILGQRLVKKTVNFDDPGTYHFYYGDERGTPGTILTFFPWEGMRPGRTGPGAAGATTYALPAGALPFWEARLKGAGVDTALAEQFGRKVLQFADRDGLPVELEERAEEGRPAWTGSGIPGGAATLGFARVNLIVRRLAPTAAILTELFGYRLLGSEGNRHRFAADGAVGAAEVDLLLQEEGPAAQSGSGTIHHVAFRVQDEDTLMRYRDIVERAGHAITPKIDRDYFYSLYFREPGGILFEIATDNPGFLRDEPLESLGTALRLPARYESIRSEIEAALPQLRTQKPSV